MPFAAIFKIEPAERSNHHIAILLELDESKNFLHQGATCQLALNEGFVTDVYMKGYAGGRNQLVLEPDFLDKAFDR